MRREFKGLRGVGPDMKSIARSLVIMLVALIAVPALVVSVTITATVQLLATVTGFYMGGRNTRCRPRPMTRVSSRTT